MLYTKNSKHNSLHIFPSFTRVVNLCRINSFPQFHDERSYGQGVFLAVEKQLPNTKSK